MGKYVEIPMCGSLMLGDLPFEDADEISNFILQADLDTPENEIIENIKYHLKNPNNMKKKFTKFIIPDGRGDVKMVKKFKKKCIKRIASTNYKSTGKINICDEWRNI